MTTSNQNMTKHLNESIASIVNVNHKSDFELDHGVTALIILTDTNSAVNDILVINIIFTACDKME